MRLVCPDGTIFESEADIRDAIDELMDYDAAYERFARKHDLNPIELDRYFEAEGMANDNIRMD